jgi:phospholipase C
MSNDRSQAMDHVVLAMFENRSFDNLLGHLYGPEEGSGPSNPFRACRK